jgi:integrase
MGLGPLNVVSGAEAVARARVARLQIMDGLDPIATRKAAQAQAAQVAAATITFSEAARRYHHHHSGRWTTEKTRRQWLEAVERFTFLTLGALPVAAIDRSMVLRTFSPHWVPGGKLTTLRRVLNGVASILDFATQHGWREGDNPADWKHLKHALAAPSTLAKTQSHAALPYAELPAFFASLGGSVVEAALKFTILTAARSAETLGARHGEIDEKHALWTLSAARMKGRREHVVPLPQVALDILRDLPREKGNPHIFIGNKKGAGLHSLAMIEHVRRKGCTWTVHGLRSSFRDWAAERTNFPPDIIEMALAHLVGSSVERAYSRSTLIERRRELMSRWADFCLGVETGAKVITLRR